MILNLINRLYMRSQGQIHSTLNAPIAQKVGLSHTKIAIFPQNLATWITNVLLKKAVSLKLSFEQEYWGFFWVRMQVSPKNLTKGTEFYHSASITGTVRSGWTFQESSILIHWKCFQALKGQKFPFWVIRNQITFVVSRHCSTWETSRADLRLQNLY